MSSSSQVAHNFNVLVVGAPGVGKTSLVRRYCEDAFRDKQEPTQGVKRCLKDMDCDHNNKRIQLTLHDCGGKCDDSLAQLYPSVHGVLIVYDITDHHTFDDVTKWVDRVRRNCSKWVTMIIVGSKSDLDARRKVNFEYADGFAFQIRIEHMEISSKNVYESHVDEVFRLLAKELIGTAEAHGYDVEGDVEAPQEDEQQTPARRMPIKHPSDRGVSAGAQPGSRGEQWNVPPVKPKQSFGEDPRDAAEEIDEARHTGSEKSSSYCTLS